MSHRKLKNIFLYMHLQCMIIMYHPDMDLYNIIFLYSQLKYKIDIPFINNSETFFCCNKSLFKKFIQIAQSLSIAGKTSYTYTSDR